MKSLITLVLPLAVVAGMSGLAYANEGANASITQPTQANAENLANKAENLANKENTEIIAKTTESTKTKHKKKGHHHRHKNHKHGTKEADKK